MKINKYLLGVVAAAALLSSCNDRELKELTNQAYIAQTGTQAGRIGSLQLGEQRSLYGYQYPHLFAPGQGSDLCTRAESGSSR